MASTSDIKNGLCIKYNNDIYKIIEFLHVKPGKGPAFVRTKLRSLTNGKVLDNTFSAGHKIDEVRVENHKFQYLYPEGDEFHFMNVETFEHLRLRNRRQRPHGPHQQDEHDHAWRWPWWRPSSRRIFECERYF
jgi:elongation factor P